MAINQLPARSATDKKFQWDLAALYQTTAAWEEDFKKLKADLLTVERLRPGFLESGPKLLELLELKEQISRCLDKLFVYARMGKDQDNADPSSQALVERVHALAIETGSALSFIMPALLSLEPDQLQLYRSATPGLKLYDHFFEELERQKAHVLSAAEEKLLAESGELADAARAVFRMFDNADLKFPAIKDEDGEMVELTKGRYSKFMESCERTVRQEAFAALYGTYGKFENSLGAMLGASVKADLFYAKARRFPSALEASLDSDNIPTTVYEQLIATIHQFLPELHRYLRLRRQVLNLPQLQMYDLYTPLVPEYQRRLEYPQARQLVREGLQPLGEDYLKLLDQGFDNGWIDVYENQGKTSGAYAWGCYDSHPYVLLNYQDKLHDAFTIAHELGHAMHSYFSNQAQPYIYSGYRIFLAEVASTVNETLLMEDLLTKASEPTERQYLLNQYLEQFRTTVFRQTMFAEFEWLIHRQLESGGALTAAWFKEKYLELNDLYYGAEVTIDPEIALEWARIPHFYSDFYVYKYATGYTAAITLSQQLLQEGPSAQQRYRTFLSSGDSDYPLELLRAAGVDLTTPAPIAAALKVFSQLLDQLTELLAGQSRV